MSGAVDLSEAKRVVVKIGSALVADTNGNARMGFLERLAADMTALRERSVELILVSSGAIALGRSEVPNPQKLEEKQAAAALGQLKLMAALQQAFASHGIVLAQALLTLEDTEDRRRWLNARATLETLLPLRVLPVINENDTVATDEIRYGDNDRLAARVAQMVSADSLVLLSDIDGLYTADPRLDPSAQHVPVVEHLTEDILAMGGGRNASAGMGSGGMATKLQAAQIAWEAGCRTVIAKGDSIAGDGQLGLGGKATWFLPPMTPNTARQNWLSGHLTPEGTLQIDAGAERALKQGASLLPVGVQQVTGRFERGAAVAIQSESGAMLGKGVTAYASEDIDRIKGLQSGDVEARLGYRGRPAVIHRDDLILV